MILKSVVHLRQIHISDIRRRMSTRLICWVSVFVLSLFSSQRIWAQSASDIANQAQQALMDGNSKKSIELYEKLLKDFPTFEARGPARFNLGQAYFAAREHDKSIQQFKELVEGKNVDAKLVEQSALMICNVETAKALALSAGFERERVLSQSIQSFDAFLQKYPQSKQRDDALYGKAAAQLRCGEKENWLKGDKLTEAEKTLNEFFATTPDSNLISEAAYLFGRVYAAQAYKAKLEQKDAEAKNKTLLAYKRFEEVWSKKNLQDLSLKNEARISAGSAFMVIENYSAAIQNFRQVKPTQFIIAEQEKYLKDLEIRRNQAVTNKPLQEQLTKEYDRAQRRLRDLKEGPDYYLDAQLSIAQSFFGQEKYDEVVVIARRFFPFFNEEQQRRASYIMIKAFLQKKQPDLAVKEFNEAKSKSLFVKGKVGEELPIEIADYFMRNQQFDESVKWTEQYIAMFPGGASEEMAYYLKMMALTQAGPEKAKEAEQANQVFQQKFPNSRLASDAAFTQAFTSFQKSEYKKAIDEFRKYIAKFPNEKLAEDAAFRVGISLHQLNQFDDAIKELKAFEQKYPKSRLLVSSLFQMAQTYKSKRDIANANAVYARIVKDYPNEELQPNEKAGPLAQFEIAKNLTEAGPKLYHEAIAAFDRFLELYPNDSKVPGVYFYKAEIFKNSKKKDEALKTYEEIIAKFPGSKIAADAKVATGDIYFPEAFQRILHPEKLPAEKQTEWKESAQKAQQSYEDVIKKFPNTEAVDRAISELNQIWQKRFNAGFASKDEAKNYLEKLSDSASDPALKTKISFALGSLLNEMGDKEAGLKVLSDAYEKAGNVSLPNQGYHVFRKTLIEAKQLDRAIAVSEKQLQEKTEAGDQEGIAEANLGLGQLYFEKGDLSKASAHLDPIINNSPWFKSFAEAKFYQIYIKEKKKNYQEAIEEYKEWNRKNPAHSLRPTVNYRLAHSYLAHSESSSNKAQDILEASANFIRAGDSRQFPHAAEALYMAATLQEKYAGLVSDAKAKEKALEAAKNLYNKCIKEHPNTPWAEKAKGQLK